MAPPDTWGNRGLLMSGMETCPRSGQPLVLPQQEGHSAALAAFLVPVWAQVCRKLTERSLPTVGSLSRTEVGPSTPMKWTNTPKASSGPAQQPQFKEHTNGPWTHWEVIQLPSPLLGASPTQPGASWERSWRKLSLWAQDILTRFPGSLW